MNSRKVTLDILLEIDKGGYSNLILDRYLKKVKDSRDRALITEMVYGVLRLKKRLDYIINQFSNIPIKKMDPAVLQALRMGIYQIVFLHRIPVRAAVYETVESIKGTTNKGAVKFVNGVLRNIIRKKDKLSYPDPDKDIMAYLMNYLSHPEWLVKYWLGIYGLKKTIELCKYNNETAELLIRINLLKYSEEDFLTLYKKKGIELIPAKIPQSYIVTGSIGVETLPLYREGGFVVQGSAATLAGLILNPAPGMRVLDMAAAPGGKTTHLAELMDNQGEIIALDIYDHKLKLIADNCKRLGIQIVKTVNSDSKNFKSDDKFDMILLDAPCTGLGLIKQKPEIRWNKTINDIEELSIIQLEMLQNGLNLLKDGGILLYSTCTLSKEENQENIGKILKLYKDNLELLDIREDLKRLGIDDLYETDENGVLEMFPPDSNTEGFFIAKLKKS